MRTTFHTIYRATATMLLLFACAQSSCAQATIEQKNAAHIFRNARITGAQWVVTENGRSHQYAFGKASDEKADTVTNATIFQAASLSKMVMAYITLKMLDQGFLSLDTPLYKYYANPRIKSDDRAKKITARMVLHHQSGLPNWAFNPTGKGWKDSELKTAFEPRSAWSYSGEGFMFLQYAIEKIMQAPLEKIAIDQVFKPLKMTSSSFLWQNSFDPLAAYGYNKNGEQTERTEFFLPAAAYSLMTTATDYDLFINALANGIGLNPATYQLMLKDIVKVKIKSGDSARAGANVFWGLGMGIQENQLGRAIWHWGDNGDYKAFVLAFPGQHKSISYFSNDEKGLDVVKELLGFYFGKADWWAVQWLEAKD